MDFHNYVLSYECPVCSLSDEKADTAIIKGRI
jgi:hypothetical protein